MRVVWATAYGGPDVLVPGEAPEPTAGQAEVVIDVHAAALTFVDTQIRNGTDKWHPAPAVPYIPGSIISGRVCSVGSDVDPTWLGRDVIADTGHSGGFAERAAAPVVSLIAVPHGVSLRQAAALYTDGSTAVGLIEGARVASGEWVLVEAAAGGLGTLLVQLARAAGAHVIGAAQGARKLDFVNGLGVDAAVDYGNPDWAERVRALTGGHGPHVVFDGIGGEIGRTAFELVASGGRFSIHGASSGDVTIIEPQEALDRRVEVFPIGQLFGFHEHQRAWLEQILKETAEGRIKPVIGQTFPLKEAARAHALIEARATLGKTLLMI